MILFGLSAPDFLLFHEAVSFSRRDWLFPPSAREVSPGNRSNYKSTRERVDSKGLYGRWRLHLMGSWRRRWWGTTGKTSHRYDCEDKGNLDGMRHQKVRGREEDWKLVGEGLSRKSETKWGGRVVSRDRRVGQTVRRLYAPTDATRHDDND